MFESPVKTQRRFTKARSVGRYRRGYIADAFLECAPAPRRVNQRI